MKGILPFVIFLLPVLPTVARCQIKDSYYDKMEKAPGVKKILIDGKFWVWTQKIGDGKINVLLLHGGPAQSHEPFEIFSQWLPTQGITIYYYDQFGSYFSETPTEKELKDTSIWKLPRYVDEVEQVRKGLNLERLFIYGHSYGALLALAYCNKYQEHVAGLIFSDMNPYPEDLGKMISLTNGETDSIMNAGGQYHNLIQNKMNGLPYDTMLYRNAFEKTRNRNYLIRLDSIPDAMDRTFRHRNFQVFQKVMPSTFSLNYREIISKIRVPVLLISGYYDFVISPAQLKSLSSKFQNAQYFVVPDAAHIAFIDNPKDYFPPMIKFIKQNQ
jgi:proline iminopeptidase